MTIEDVRPTLFDSVSQKERILDYLKRGNKITSLKALDLFRCARLASRINELRSMNYDITSELVKGANGSRYAEYTLVQK